MSKKNVYLSAGHSGKTEKGAASQWLNEKEEAAELCNLVKSNTKCLVGFKTSTLGLGLSQRIKEANAFCGVGSGVAVEIHFNASGKGTAQGCEAVIADNASQKSREIATRLAATVAECTGIKYRGVKTEAQTARKKLAFVRDTSCPAVILEVCFCDNEEDVKKYQEHKEMLAYLMALYFDQLC